MNRSALKRFATSSRTELRQMVAARAAQLGITPKHIEPTQVVTGGLLIGGRTFNLSRQELSDYQQLQAHLSDLQRQMPLAEAVEHLVNEVAYTWFNRLAALRFMEVNGYIGRVFSSSTPGSLDPDLLVHAPDLIASGELQGIAIEDLEATRREARLNGRPEDSAVYRRLLIAQSHAQSRALPFMFGKQKNFLDLFLPDNLLLSDSIVRRIVEDIPEADWQEIEIVGWLYQFYISERKDEVMAAKGAIDPEDIPAATQLFTPRWIVRYMVENSLGRTWLEAHPESGLKAHMPYYLEAEKPSAAPNPALEPQDLTVMDPACGSGHILVYAFDLLFEIYSERGYAAREIPELILKHNLFGLDLDERAIQLASFALAMKARAKNRRFLNNPPQFNLAYVQSTKGWKVPATPELRPADWQPLLDAFREADSLGSLITPPPFDAAELHRQLMALEGGGSLYVDESTNLRELLQQAELLARKYKAVVANPPYMGSKGFNKPLKDFVNAKYPRSKSDLFAVFMERTLEATEPMARMAMINQQSWMFLSSYEDLRDHLLGVYSIESMLHLGPRTFPEIGGEVVQSTAFTIRNQVPKATECAVYDRLVDLNSTDEKEQAFLAASNRFKAISQRNFEKIPGSPIAYWVSKRVLEVFSKEKKLADLFPVKSGIMTGNDERFLRFWHEVSEQQIPVSPTYTELLDRKYRWYRLSKGGDYRKWYGNNEHVVNLWNDGYDIKTAGSNFRLREKTWYFKPYLTWSRVSSGTIAFRQVDESVLFADAAPGIFHIGSDNLLTFLDSKVSTYFLDILNPTINYQTRDIELIPYKSDTTTDKSQARSRIVLLSKSDWDNFETSWDFQTHPLVRGGFSRLSEAFDDWDRKSVAAFNELKRLEEENNRYWIEAYGLQDELSPEVPDDQITIRLADLGRDVRSLISYAVGCMFGRYSLDKPGLMFAGGTFDPAQYSRFPADADGILPITDDSYFPDDIVVRFVEFLRVAYGETHLQENLDFVANALERRDGENATDRIRRYFLSEFISDHIKIYKKRPIYWYFTSGKKRAFGALVYLHRYTPNTLAQMRSKYVLEMQRKLTGVMERAQEIAQGGGPEGRRAAKQVKDLQAQMAELRSYHEIVQHAADQRMELDLDDGVAYNYTLMEGLVYEGPDLKMDDLKRASQWKRDLLAGKK